MKVWLVMVNRWGGGDIIYSIHKTNAGAKAILQAANEAYDTNTAYVDEGYVHD